jgi:hypothetical protein
VEFVRIIVGTVYGLKIIDINVCIILHEEMLKLTTVNCTLLLGILIWPFRRGYAQESEILSI